MNASRVCAAHVKIPTQIKRAPANLLMVLLTCTGHWTNIQKCEKTDRLVPVMCSCWAVSVTNRIRLDINLPLNKNPTAGMRWGTAKHLPRVLSMTVISSPMFKMNTSRAVQCPHSCYQRHCAESTGQIKASLHTHARTHPCGHRNNLYIWILIHPK